MILKQELKKILIIMGLMSFLFGCSQNKKETLKIDGKEIIVKESDNPISEKYGLKALSEEQKNEFVKIKEKAEIFIKKYSKNENYFDTENLDYVLEKWKNQNSTIKENKENVIELLGYAFGEIINKELNCEWKILTDEYGTDYTVINKKYKINGFPFSSVMKAIDENRIGSLNEIKLVIKKNIYDAENGSEYDKR